MEREDVAQIIDNIEQKLNELEKLYLENNTIILHMNTKNTLLIC